MQNGTYLERLLSNLYPLSRLIFKWFSCNVSILTGGLKPNISEYTLRSTNITLGLGDQISVPFDQFVVTCFNRTKLDNTRTDDSAIYQRAFAGFPVVSMKTQIPLATPSNPSIILIILDSTSRNNFIRHAPLSYEYMKELGFLTLNGYTKVGDNSGVNLFPVLAGQSTKATKDLPINAESVEFLWDLMRSEY